MKQIILTLFSHTHAAWSRQELSFFYRQKNITQVHKLMFYVANHILNQNFPFLCSLLVSCCCVPTKSEKEKKLKPEFFFSPVIEMQNNKKIVPSCQRLRIKGWWLTVNVDDNTNWRRRQWTRHISHFRWSLTGSSTFSRSKLAFLSGHFQNI